MVSCISMNMVKTNSTQTFELRATNSTGSPCRRLPPTKISSAHDQIRLSDGKRARSVESWRKRPNGWSPMIVDRTRNSLHASGAETAPRRSC